MESNDDIHITHRDSHNTLLRKVRRVDPISDYEGNLVEIVWYPGVFPSHRQPAFSFQVYLTRGATNITVDREFSTRLAATLERWRLDAGQPSFPYHLEIYSKHLLNIFSCARHQFHEVSYRNRNGLCPRLVASWEPDWGTFTHAIFVIDSDRWADEGLTFVRYKPMDDPSNAYDGVLENKGDILRAWQLRPATPGGIHPVPQVLHNTWLQVGHRWTEAYLQRRNDGGIGGMSPVLYPAMDPEAHFDVEHDDEEALNALVLTSLSDAESDDQGLEDPRPRSVTRFDLIKRIIDRAGQKDSDRLTVDSYKGIHGRPVTSIWDVRKSRMRPSFTVTLYLGEDLPPLRPKALFVHLDTGDLASKSWTLDVISNIANIDAAWEYHNRSSARRTFDATKKRRECAHMIVNAIAKPAHLPHELVEIIANHLVPPELPNYGQHHMQPMQNFFMYLDHRHLPISPLMVFSDPILPRRNDDEVILGTLFTDKTVNHTWLRVKLYQNWRHWERASRDINALWSLCTLPLSEIDDEQVRRLLHDKIY